MDLKETYNQIAENWHEDHAGDAWWVPGVDAFLSFLSKGALVWDAGCGAGVKSKYLAQKGAKVFGTDFSEKMVEISRKEVPDAEFSVSDIRHPELVEKEFDGIFLQAVLLHIPKKEAQEVVSGLTRKLKRGGYFYIAVKEKREGGVDEEVKREGDYGFMYERFFSYFTLEEIKEMLKIAGCEIVYENVAQTPVTRWVQVIGKR